MRYSDNWKYKKREEDEYHQPSPREKRRKEEIELKKFQSSVVVDKIWFQSLKHSDQMVVYRKYTSESYSWQFDNGTLFDIMIFWENLKKEYPGDLSKQRDIKLDSLLK